MKRTALLVLGMHEADASDLTRVFGALGAAFPSDQPARATATAPALSAKLARINDCVFEACDESAQSAASLPADAMAAHAGGVLGKQAAAFLQCHCGSAETYVLHQPPMARLLPFWLPVMRQLGHAVRVVLWAHKPPTAGMHGPVPLGEQTHLGWLGTLLDAERDTRDVPRVFVAAETWEHHPKACLDNIIQTLQLPWQASDLPEPSARASRPEPTLATHVLERWATETYRIILRGDVHVLPAFFDALRPDFDAVAAVPRLVRRALRVAQHTDLRRVQQERDAARAALEKVHGLLLELHGRHDRDSGIPT